MPPIALVRRTSAALQEGLTSHIERVPVDTELAEQQHEAYCAALVDAGYDLRYVEDAPHLPDAVYVEDTAVVVDDLAVLSRPGASERRGEVAGTEKLLREAGLRLHTIEEPGTLDGGDVLQVGSTVFVGRGGRTNGAGIAQLRDLLAPLGRTVVPVRLTEVLHLKSAVTALPDGTLLVHRDLVEPGALPPARRVSEEAGCHVVPLADGTVLISASAPRTIADLEDLGFRTRPVPMTEFEKREGCVTCLSILLPDRNRATAD
ncbi:MAG TPA: N(G),N(G)-dimethylarginine dimethylaminohydrolase [Segeticoccus sp.]|uniref:dimethylargininase n=1 Tax=Segeticoccus sp. TaxID=2706531 RepID=UPI002D7F60B9|nr:dimethylargininase [Segeticoccus sp.]HET8602074.1 N(G),N(G)-dimethylarginine dimethylaminohydrolase [Segeticoccus sp.]